MSPGGGSVMLQDMAYGGSLGTSLFVNVSPSWRHNTLCPTLTRLTDYRCIAIFAYAVRL